MQIWWTITSTDGETKNLTTNDGIVITRNNQRISMLSIESVQPRHRGSYTCKAMNRAGVSEHTAQLAIKGTFWRFSINLNIPLTPRLII